MRAIVIKFVQHVVPGVVKPLRVLWNEIIGFLFLALAVLAVRPLYQGYRDLDTNPDATGKLVMGGIFFLVMAGFGVHSFLRARKISRGR